MKNFFHTCCIALLLVCGVADAAEASLPASSVYQLPARLTSQDGKPFTLRALRGQPVLVSMFYNSCQFVCPMLIDTMRLTEQALEPAERERLAMLLITFDPARDDLATLQTIARQRALEAGRWRLARSDAASVRKIAAALDIQYRRLEDGEYNHTTVLVLLDGEGRVLGSTRKMGVVDETFLTLLRATLAAPH